MAMNTFSVNKRALEAFLGRTVDLSQFELGKDYVMKGCFNGERPVFSTHLVEGSDKSAVTCDKSVVSADDLEVSSPKSEVVEAESQPEGVSDTGEYCKVVRLYPNYRIVGTDKFGDVRVIGKLTNKMRVGLTVKVKGKTVTAA